MAHCLLDLCKFVRGQIRQAANQFGNWDRSNILRIKNSRLEVRCLVVNFETAASPL